MVQDFLIYECIGHMALSLQTQEFVGRHVICSPSTWRRNYSSNFRLWQKHKLLSVTCLQLNHGTCLHWHLEALLLPVVFLATGLRDKYWRTEGFQHHFRKTLLERNVNFPLLQGTQPSHTPSTTERPPPFPAFLSALSPGELIISHQTWSLDVTSKWTWAAVKTLSDIFLNGNQKNYRTLPLRSETNELKLQQRSNWHFSVSRHPLFSTMRSVVGVVCFDVKPTSKKRLLSTYCLW